MAGLPIIVAHGALGWWDEIIYVTIALVFLVFMALSWLRSRNAELETDEMDLQPHTGDTSTDADTHEGGDRFRLE